MRTSITKTRQRVQFELLAEEIVHVGIDVHKRDYKVHVWSQQQERPVSAWVQPSQIGSLINRLDPIRHRVGRIVYEAGPTGYGLCRALRRAGFNADVIAPSRTPQTTSPSAKCDRLDARKLAMYSAKGLLQPVEVPSEEQEADRQLARMREMLMKKLRRVKQQIKSLLLQHGLVLASDCGGDWSRSWLAAARALELMPQLRFSLDLLLDELDHLRALLKRTNHALRELAAQPRHQAIVTALQTTPGVGPVTAMVHRTELVRPERFDDERQVTAMAGLAPMVYSSGQSLRQGPLMKTGNGRLRTALIEAAWRWVAKDPWAAQRFARLQRQTGSRKKAIVAMSRRLNIILWRMSLTGQPYQPKSIDDNGSAVSCQPGLSGSSCQAVGSEQAGRKKRVPAQRRRQPLSAQTSG